MQIQTHLLSKTGAKIVIALKGDTNGYSGILAVDGDGKSTDQRTLRVAGTITLKTGWKISVQIFARDNWMAKSSSAFSCHVFKTFDGCTNKQTAQALARAFTFVKDQMNNTINRTSRADTNVDIMSVRAAEGFKDDVMGVSYVFIYLSVVIILVIQMY